MIIKDLGKITEPSGSIQHRVIVRCEVCKQERETRISRVKDSYTACRECQIKARNFKHGLHGHPLRGVHNTMKQRCSNKNTNMYYRYGARGITVCKEWDEFKPFYDWAINNGYKDGLTIDRINNDGNYEPNNCQWITLEENISKNAKLSKNDIDSICKIYLQSNITQKELAFKYRIDISRVGQILKENNIETTYRGGTKKKISIENVNKIILDKRIASEIALDYGVHKSTIYSIKRGKYNVQ